MRSTDFNFFASWLLIVFVCMTQTLDAQHLRNRYPPTVKFINKSININPRRTYATRTDTSSGVVLGSVIKFSPDDQILGGNYTPKLAAQEEKKQAKIYKIEKNEILLSEDRGNTWDAVRGPKEVSHVAWDTERPLHIVAAARDGIYLSFDGARSWQLRLWQPSNFIPESLELVNGNGSIIQLTDTMPTPNGQIQKQEWRSIDGGISWQQASHAGNGAGSPEEKTEETSHSAMITTTRAGGDTSGGIAWGPIIKLSPDDPCPSGGNYTPKIATQGDTIHCIWETGQFRMPYIRSTDGGVTWEEPRNILEDTSVSPCNTGWHHIIADTKNVYIFYVYGLCVSGVVALPVYFIKSSDRGNTWSLPLRASNDSAGAIFSASVRGDTMACVYVPDVNDLAKYPRVTRSIDAGTTWTRSSQEMPSSTSDALRGILTPGLFNLFHPGDSWPGPAPEIVLHRSMNFADTWKDSSVISELDGWGSQRPRAASLTNDTTGATTVAAIWRDTRYGGGAFSAGIVSRLSYDNGQIWQSEQLLNDPPLGDFMQITLKENNVATVWTQEPIANTVFRIQGRVSYYSGHYWENVFSATPPDSNSYSMVPDVALTHSAVHVVWEEDEEKDPHAVYRRWNVFYRRGERVECSGTGKVITYEPGWNLISLPVVTENVYSFPSLFAYDGGYVKVDSMSLGKGYWAKPSRCADFIGSELLVDTINVTAKWNIIGTLAVPLAASNVQSIPDGNIISSVYGYNGISYFEADTLYPGKGYWVKVREEGKIILNSFVK